MVMLRASFLRRHNNKQKEKDNEALKKHRMGYPAHKYGEHFENVTYFVDIFPKTPEDTREVYKKA